VESIHRTLGDRLGSLKKMRLGDYNRNARTTTVLPLKRSIQVGSTGGGRRTARSKLFLQNELRLDTYN